MTEGKIHFLTLEELVEIHRHQVKGTDGPLGLRHEGLLRACLALPANKIGGTFAHRDLYEMAAAYLFHIIDQKPFLRGNKRVAPLAALYFLHLHDIEITAQPQELVEMVESTAHNKTTKMQIADFLRKRAVQKY